VLKGNSRASRSGVGKLRDARLPSRAAARPSKLDHGRLNDAPKADRRAANHGALASRKPPVRAPERLQLPIYGRMLPVLDFDPVGRAAGAIGPVRTLGDQILEPELARLAEKVRSYLATLELRYEDTIRSTREQAGEIGLAHRERQLTNILPAKCEDVEGTELHFSVVLARV
jgi:hypothetical protein